MVFGFEGMLKRYLHFFVNSVFFCLNLWYNVSNLILLIENMLKKQNIYPIIIYNGELVDYKIFSKYIT